MAKLYFYYSAMNAGKTTTLLQSSYNYQERGMRTLLYLPDFDTRYAHGKIASRIGLVADGITFDQHFNFFEDVRNHLQPGYKMGCIFVDEAHFLSKEQVQQLVDIVTEFNIPVLTYGLRSDFQGEPFPGSQYLLAWAEELAEIKTICHCGRKATMNARIDAQGHQVMEGAQVEIGGNERYISLCRKHFEEGRKKYFRAQEMIRQAS